MGHLVAVGGLHIPSTAVGKLERDLDDLCGSFGFPTGEEFKWSPGRGQWMRKSLTSAKRTEFYRAALGMAQERGARGIVVVEDTNAARAVAGTPSPEEDVVMLFLERADNYLRSTGTEALVVADQPSGGREAEHRFLSGCLARMRAGTEFVKFARLTLLLTSDSRLSRLVQLADVVTGCTVSYIAGESTFAPITFQWIRPLLREELGRIGGVGVKIHPDGRYANLYHWLLGDEYLVRYPQGLALPTPGRAYWESPDEP
jgi:uncharacterized protein DUF3800